VRGPYLNKWKMFERLVAAIHLLDEGGSQIRWNDRINGRQFDVTMRNRKGFYDYLTVIECKNLSSPVPVKEVEAFITKSHDVGAHKAIMVSSIGFQSGTEEVAKLHAVDLFTLKAVTELPAEIDSNEIGYALNIYEVRLRFPGKKKKGTLVLSEERNMLPYLLKNTVFKREGAVTSLRSIIDSVRVQISEKAKDETQVFRMPLPSGTKAKIPISSHEYTVSALSFKYELVPAKTLRGDARLDPALLDVVFMKYYYENVITKEQFVIPNKDIKIGFDTVLEVGKFYVTPGLEFSYYCEHIDGDLATIFLVESYQHGDLLQMQFKQTLENAKHYIEVEDKNEIARLRKMYELH